MICISLQILIWFPEYAESVFCIITIFSFFFCGSQRSGKAKTLRETQCSGVKIEGSEQAGGRRREGGAREIIIQCSVTNAHACQPLPELACGRNPVGASQRWVPTSHTCILCTHEHRICCLTNESYRDKRERLDPADAMSDFLKGVSSHLHLPSQLGPVDRGASGLFVVTQPRS